MSLCIVGMCDACAHVHVCDMCVCMHTHVYAHICTHVYVCMSAHVYVMFICAYVYIAEVGAGRRVSFYPSNEI